MNAKNKTLLITLGLSAVLTGLIVYASNNVDAVEDVIG